jgi:hypothetical protein
MSIQNNTITESYIKNYLFKFLWVVFCCFDTLNGTITSFNELHFDRFHKDIKIEDLFSSAFQEYQELNANYDEVLIIHNNNLSTLVPTFDENYLGSYLQYNTKVFETDFLLLIH